MELQDLIKQSGENAEAKGFHDDGNLLREIISRLTEHGSVLSVEDGLIDIPNEFWDRLYAAYKGNRLMLMVSELVEVHDEVRNGKPPIYEGEGGKPEGTAVELADVQIRLGDYAWEFGEPIQGAIDTKARFNSTRERFHGGKKF